MSETFLGFLKLFFMISNRRRDINFKRKHTNYGDQSAISCNKNWHRKYKGNTC